MSKSYNALTIAMDIGLLDTPYKNSEIPYSPKVRLPYGQFLGYEKGEDGLPKIVEKEAEVVRKIYKLFLKGKIPLGIAKELTE